MVPLRGVRPRLVVVFAPLLRSAPTYGVLLRGIHSALNVHLDRPVQRRPE